MLMMMIPNIAQVSDTFYAVVPSIGTCSSPLNNTQALFRPMSMMIPDYALVAEVMLFSEGFEDSKTLSRKMVNLYKLSSEQLSQQVRWWNAHALTQFWRLSC